MCFYSEILLHLYGDIYNEELVKSLQSKEAKKYQNSYKEVDPKYYNKGA